MESSALHAALGALNAAGVRYLVVGGLAVVAHGYARLTMDVDIVLDLEESNLKKAIAALAPLEYRPRAPVPFEEFASREKREEWVRTKHMRVFSVWSARYPLTEIDLFIALPFESFEAAYDRRAERELGPGLDVPFVGRDDLLAMKREAGRPKDLEDIRLLEALATPPEHEDD